MHYSNHIEISPSILSARMDNLGEDIKLVDQAGAHRIHLDIMDGHFVPNLSFGPATVKSIRPYTKKPFDAHLMLSKPINYIEPFADSGADLIFIHVEADLPAQTVEKIIASKTQAGLTINPGTTFPSALKIMDGMQDKIASLLIMTVEPGFGNQSFMEDQLPKIEEAANFISNNQLNMTVQVDGGVNQSNAKSIIDAGAQVLIAGSAVYKNPGDTPLENYRSRIEALLNG